MHLVLRMRKKKGNVCGSGGGGGQAVFGLLIPPGPVPFVDLVLLHVCRGERADDEVPRRRQPKARVYGSPGSVILAVDEPPRGDAGAEAAVAGGLVELGDRNGPPPPHSGSAKQSV